MNSQDTIYQNPRDHVTGFVFDEKVVNVFPDMIQRSVPGYSTIISMTGVLAGRYAQNNTNCYDLGCSLGASTLSIAEQLISKPSYSKPSTLKNISIIAVDNSAAMLERCQGILGNRFNNIQFSLKNIEETEITNASVVVMNFSLQFISPPFREKILRTIYNGMNKGGILLLSEKIIFEDQHLNQLNIDLHHEFKKSNGYSDLEISQKRTALENVLIPESLQAHEKRLTGIGFHHCDVWFQCFNFASLVAIK